MTVTTDTPTWTAATVNRALYTHFANQQWAVLFEVGERTDGRRIDALCVRKARRMGIGHLETLAIEVKVTRGDFLSDVKRPEKQAAWRELAHRHAYAVPEGMVTKDEVPEGCGLIYVGRNEYHPQIATVAWAKKPPYTPTEHTLPSWLVQNIALRCGWAEGQLKGFSGVETYDRDGSDTVESLRARLANEKRRGDKEHARAEREHARATLWRGLVGAMAGMPCADCGQMLRPSRLNRNGYGGVVWVHVDAAHEEPCLPLRLANDEARARASAEKWGHPYHPARSTYTPDPRPADDTEEDYQ